MDARTLQTLLQEQLAGRLLRIVRPGEFATQEIRPGRVTVWLDEAGRVTSVRVDGATQALDETI